MIKDQKRNHNNKNCNVDEKDEELKKDMQDKHELKQYEELIDIDEDYELKNPDYERLFRQERLVSAYFKDKDGNGYYVINVRGGTVTIDEGHYDYIYSMINGKRDNRYQIAWCDMMAAACLLDVRIRDLGIELEYNVIQTGYRVLGNMFGVQKQEKCVEVVDKFNQRHFPFNSGPFYTGNKTRREIKYTKPKEGWVKLKGSMYSPFNSIFFIK